MVATLQRALVVHLLTLVVMVGLTGWAWLGLPGESLIPISWSAAGDVSDTSSKAVGLLMVPGLSLGLLFLFWALPAIEPRRGNLLRSAPAYGVVWGGIAILLMAIHGMIVAAAFGREPAIERMMPIMIGALFMALGWVMPLIRSNFMMGIRTPWTLSSELAWTETHRVGRWVFMAVGLGLIGLGVLGAGETAFLVVIGGAIVASLGLMVYSYTVWRGDPDRQRDEG